MAFCMVILIIDVEYAVSICLFFWLLMIFLSSLSLISVFYSITNLFLVLCVVGYRNFTVFGFRFCLSISPNLDPVAPNRHPLYFVVVATVSRYLVDPPPSSLYWVVVLGSIPSLTPNHKEGFCDALSLMLWLWYVPHLDQHWVCVYSYWCWGDITIRCGLHHIRMSRNMRGYCEFSWY